MNTQVLSIEQMQELIELGIDTSKASMCWVNDKSSIFLDCNYQSYTEEDKLYLNVIPTFTLQDCLEMLPNTIEWKGITYWFSIFINGFGNKMIGYRDSELWALEFKSFNINGAFYMLKWCKQNNFI